MPITTATAVVAGHICLDITPIFTQSADRSAAQLLTPGQLVHIGAADVHTGGCVANTGLALQRFGVPTRLVAKTGADAFGRLIGDLLAKENVAHTLSVDAQSTTSYSIVVAPPGMDRVFWHHSGANALFSNADAPDETLIGAQLLHFGYPPLMNRLCQNNGEELTSLLRRAKQLGLATSLDLAAIDPQSEIAGLDWQKLLSTWLPWVDFFMPSAEELCFMLDRSLHKQWVERSNGGDITDVLSITQDIQPLAESALALNCKIVVIKCGARGMYYQAQYASALSGIGLPLPISHWAGIAGFQPSFIPRKVVSATGAGDTSIAAFLASALEGLPLARCVQRAAAAGACCVEAYDALSGLEPLASLDSRIAAGWALNPIR